MKSSKLIPKKKPTEGANQVMAWFMVSIAALFYNYEFVLRVAPSTMFDELMAFYNITTVDVGNIVIFYMLAYTPMQLVVGPLFDKYGIKKLLILAVSCCILGSYLVSAVTSIWICKAGLFLIGFGSAFAFVGTLNLAVGIINKNHLALVSGITTALGMLGAICGQSITACLILHFNWQYAWGLYAVAGVIILFALIVFIKEPTQNYDEVDVHNSQIFFKELILLTQNKTILLCGLIGGVLYMPTSVFGSLWGVPYLKSVFPSISTLQASNTVSMMFIGMMIGCPLTGTLNRYIDSKKLLIYSSISVIILNITLIFFTPIFLPLIGIILFFMGLMCGTEVLTFTIAVESSARHLSASAMAFVNFIIMAIGGIMQYIIGFTLNYFWDGTIINGTPIYDSSAYQIAISTIPLSLGLVTLIFIYEVFFNGNRRV